LAGVSSPVAASSDLDVAGPHLRPCVLATNDDPHPKPDATYDHDHLAALAADAVMPLLPVAATPVGG